jgi:hypothetical protein
MCSISAPIFYVLIYAVGESIINVIRDSLEILLFYTVYTLPLPPPPNQKKSGYWGCLMYVKSTCMYIRTCRLLVLEQVNGAFSPFKYLRDCLLFFFSPFLLHVRWVPVT